MNKVTTFISKNFQIIVLTLLAIIFLRTCGSDSTAINKRIDKLSNKVDSLQTTSVTKTDLQIEGLKVEKRMIQSTDRKILDVNRQSEIDRELQSLQK